MNTTAGLPADQPARSAIAERLDENLVVEAGAGTGKTRSLVERVAALVTTGAATMDGVAAITFTEAAAAELRERIRQSLEQAASASTTPSAETKRCLQAVEDLDQGAIQTLHGFAASLLRQRPLEAGLPPGFETLDATQSDMAFEDRWSRWLDAALEDPEAQEALRPALVLGLELRHLREIAAQFHENYNLLASVSFSAPPIPGPAGARALVDARPPLEFLSTLAKSPDSLSAHVENVITLARRMENAVSDPLEAYRLLAQSPPVGSKSGRQANWNADPDNGSNGATALKDLLQDLEGRITRNLAHARAAALGPVLELLRSFALEYARHRKADGVAEFHDLLVWARDLLRDDLDARDYFRGRYSHVLIDEMQDTDPLQAEIAMFLAEDAPPEAPPRARPRHWTEVKPGAGRIFVVGDPKQSIYRFRRADVQLMRRAQEIVGAERLVLSQNFRSRPGVIDWVNHVFGNWMQPGPQPDVGPPEYIPLNPNVEDWADGADYDTGYTNGITPAVRYIGDAVDARIGRVRREEATAIAKTILSARREGWPVRAESGDGAMRATDFRDICILMPTRTGLDVLELALEDAGIPYRLESQSMIYETQEIRDLLNCLRAIDDPTDQISVVAALRSPAFACSDVGLLAFIEGGAQEAGAQEAGSQEAGSQEAGSQETPGREAGGQFNYLVEQAGPPGHVSEAFAVLKKFHARRRWTTPSALIEEFVRCRRLMEAALGERRPRERWRRYRFLIDHARAFAIAGGASLRAFLDWTGRQQSTNARVMETSVPELDEDAVRVMTVHGAKGLEFPTVILTGLNSRRQHRPGPVLFDWREGNVEARVGRQGAYFQTGGYDDLWEADKLRDDEEFVRLLYVAATRARDHLIISCYRDAKDNFSAAARIAGFLQGADELWGEAVALPAAASASLDTTPAADTASLADDTAEARREWAEERQRVYGLRARPHSVAVTGIAKGAGEDKQEQDLPAEPWKRGRAGTSIGRAVHAVLQTVDMETGHGLEDIAKAQAAAEGVPGRSAEIARLARVALSSAVVKRALDSGRWWRETPVAGPAPPEINAPGVDSPGVDSPGIVEGFIDLLFQEEDGFVIVDYKTDALRSGDDIDRAMKQYRLQGGGYAFALEGAVGARVKEVCFLFLQPQREITVEDLPGATKEAEQAALAYLAGE